LLLEGSLEIEDTVSFLPSDEDALVIDILFNAVGDFNEELVGDFVPVGVLVPAECKREALLEGELSGDFGF